jgi:hypothetical protein
MLGSIPHGQRFGLKSGYQGNHHSGKRAEWAPLNNPVLLETVGKFAAR